MSEITTKFKEGGGLILRINYERLLIDYGCPGTEYINGKITEFTISFDNDSSGITIPNKTTSLSTAFTKDSPMLIIKIPREDLGGNEITTETSLITILFPIITASSSTSCEVTLYLDIDLTDYSFSSNSIDLSKKGYWQYINIL